MCHREKLIDINGQLRFPPEAPVKTSVHFIGHQLEPMSCQQKTVQHLFHIYKEIPWNQEINELEKKQRRKYFFPLYGMLIKM